MRALTLFDGAMHALPLFDGALRVLTLFSLPLLDGAVRALTLSMFSSAWCVSLCLMSPSVWCVSLFDGAVRADGAMCALTLFTVPLFD